MNIHEYQGKDILKRYGVRVQEGIVADTAEEAVAAAETAHRATPARAGTLSRPRFMLAAAVKVVG